MLKRCKYCNIHQPEGNFEIAATVNGQTYRRWKCRAWKQRQQTDRRHKIYAELTEYKKTLCCSQCGFADHRALDFHHLDPNEKEFAIANFISRGASSARIKKEIQKCIVLCANCHRIEHERTGM